MVTNAAIEDFGDETRFYPVCAARRFILVKQRNFPPWQFFQAPPQIDQAFGRKSGADAAHIAPAIALRCRQQQGAEPLPRTGALGVAHDREFVRCQSLDLDPVVAATRAVRRIDALADDALEPLIAREPEGLLAMPHDVLAVT